MTILGADPDAPVRDWLDEAGFYSDIGEEVVIGTPQTRQLVNYFAYHKDMKMSQRCNDRDKAIVGQLLSRRHKQGYTPQALMKMIDRFYQSWAADSEVPSYTFISNKVQDQLLREAEVTKKDPVLEWLLFGMPNTELYKEPGEVRKAVLMASPELTHAYPDLLADAIREDDTYLGILDKIRRAEDTVFAIPKSRRRPTKETMSQAIGAIPV